MTKRDRSKMPCKSFWFVTRVILCVFIVCAEQTEAQPTVGRRTAIVIGLSGYRHSRFRDVPNAEYDATSVAAALKPLGYEVTLVLGGGIQSTKEPLEAEIQSFLEHAKNSNDIESLCVVYFGNGIRIPSHDGGEGHNYLCPWDGDPSDPASLIELDAIFIKLRDIKPRKKQLFILDVCNSTPDPNRRWFPLDTIPIAQLGTGQEVLLSCSQGQHSYVFPESKEGLFAHFLCRSLQGVAANSAGLIDWRGVVSSVIEGVSSCDSSVIGIGSPQVPQLISHECPPDSSLQLKSEPQPLKVPFTRDQALAAQISYSKQLNLPVEFRDKFGVVFVLIPPGEFEFGYELRNLIVDKPSPVVRLTRPFYMSAYELTQGQFTKIMGRNPSYFVGSGAIAREYPEFTSLDTTDFPADSVEFDNAVSVLDRLNETKSTPNFQYDLPTEAEWEYACRAGTNTAFNFGNVWNDSMANAAGIASPDPYYPFRMKPCSVGLYWPNQFGIYDMHGNVIEWCKDYNSQDFFQKESEFVDPINLEPNNIGRVQRGGYWNSSLRNLQTSHRFDRPLGMSGGVGMRVILRIQNQ